MMVNFRVLATLARALSACAAGSGAARPEPGGDAAKVDYFEKKVRPVLVNSSATAATPPRPSRPAGCASTTARGCSPAATPARPSFRASPRRA
jgi:hypothetical protein